MAAAPAARASLRFLRGHDPLEDKGQPRRADQFLDFLKAFGADGLAFEGHGNQTGPVDIHAHRQGARGFGRLEVFDGLRLGPGFGNGNAFAVMIGNGFQTAGIHLRIGAVAGHAQGAGQQGTRPQSPGGNPPPKFCRPYCRRRRSWARPGWAWRAFRPTASKEVSGALTSCKVRILKRYRPKASRLTAKALPGPDAAHARHFAGAGPTVADRADPAISL